MAEKLVSDVPTFTAQSAEERKTIVISKKTKVLRPNVIPVDLLRDEFLNSLISASLPKNYNFEIHKTIWKIQQTNSRRILLQLPEGLIRFGPILVDIISGFLNERQQNMVQFITMGDLTYGACCIDDYLASSMGCDLIVHYAHSCLVPIDQLNYDTKYLYIFLDIKFDLKHVFDCIIHNFDPQKDNIALASTIQFLMSIHELARQLRKLNFNIILPQSKPLSSGEVLGCTAPKLDSTVNTIVFICDGRFHLEALMIANPDIKTYRYDPYSRKLTQEIYAFGEMIEQRSSAIEGGIQTMSDGGTFGFILGTLGRQGSEKVFDRLVNKLSEASTKCKFLKFLAPEVVQRTLETFDSIDVWVQVACPRLSIDWGSFFHRPLLNSYEFCRSVKLFSNPDTTRDTQRYPMDYYSKESCGDHTPNHRCKDNPECGCMKVIKAAT